jgi:hypothetical protein
VTLAHGLGEGGPEIEVLMLAAGLLVLGVVFFFQKSTKPQVPVILVVLSLAMTVGAFAFSGDESEDDPVTSDVTVAIASPADGDVVPANEDLMIEVEIVNGKLVSGSTSTDPNEGHIHIYVDGQVVAMPTSESDTVVPGTNLPPGEHEVIVEFTQANHASFAPPVQTALTIVAQ